MSRSPALLLLGWSNCSFTACAPCWCCFPGGKEFQGVQGLTRRKCWMPVPLRFTVVLPERLHGLGAGPREERALPLLPSGPIGSPPDAARRSRTAGRGTGKRTRSTAAGRTAALPPSNPCHGEAVRTRITQTEKLRLAPPRGLHTNTPSEHARCRAGFQPLPRRAQSRAPRFSQGPPGTGGAGGGGRGRRPTQAQGAGPPPGWRCGHL
ncbi:uncharacterized protein LOC126067817 [Elephas maximus indicus]|uniref:uncharacterized protein LOC126067817 n=1 Tax=Elephas maximus indicus TaxID=99487 RepID=UPI0021170495|nr:uncharacterized protein LOC126067817 [Elephas maximus indicus]